MKLKELENSMAVEGKVMKESQGAIKVSNVSCSNFSVKSTPPICQLITGQLILWNGESDDPF